VQRAGEEFVNAALQRGLSGRIESLCPMSHDFALSCEQRGAIIIQVFFALHSEGTRMSDDSGGIPKFPGDLSDHLAHRVPEPPDRWSDRIRHAWLLYVMLAILLIAWVTAVVLLVVYPFAELGPIITFSAAAVLGLSFGIFARFVGWNIIAGRDPDSGKRIDPPDR